MTICYKIGVKVANFHEIYSDTARICLFTDSRRV